MASLNKNEWIIIQSCSLVHFHFNSSWFTFTACFNLFFPVDARLTSNNNRNITSRNQVIRLHWIFFSTQNENEIPPSLMMMPCPSKKRTNPFPVGIIVIKIQPLRPTSQKKTKIYSVPKTHCNIFISHFQALRKPYTIPPSPSPSSSDRVSLVAWFWSDPLNPFYFPSKITCFPYAHDNYEKPTHSTHFPSFLSNQINIINQKNRDKTSD